jgi:hypothetical protein
MFCEIKYINSLWNFHFKSMVVKSLDYSKRLEPKGMSYIQYYGTSALNQLVGM